LGDHSGGVNVGRDFADCVQIGSASYPRIRGIQKNTVSHRDNKLKPRPATQNGYRQGAT
jgi:hypothetical protein